MLVSVLCPSFTAFAATNQESKESNKVINTETNDNVSNNDFSSLPTFNEVYEETLENPTLPSGISESDVQLAYDTIQFYFNQIGTFDENGQYVLKDIEALRNRALDGDEGAQSIYLQITGENALARTSTSDAANYVVCVAINTIPIVSDIATFTSAVKSLVSGKFIQLLKTGSNYAIATAIVKMLEKLAKFIGYNTSIPGLLVNFVTSMISCAKPS